MSFPKAPLPPACLAASQDSHASATSEKLNIKVLRAKDARRAHHRVILADTHRMEYVGLNFGADAHINRYVVGVFDKDKRKVRIIDSPHIFSMEQRIKAFDDTEVIRSEEDRIKGNRQLINDFGSKKSRSLLNTSVRNRVNAEDNIDQATLESMSNSLKEKASTTMPLDEIQKGVRSDLPPYNTMGQTREEIYNFTSSMLYFIILSIYQYIIFSNHYK